MECIFPIKLKKQNWMAVPCGKCHFCLKRKALGWSVRLMAEHRDAKTSWFITLTYDNENLPINEKTFTPELRKSDVQKFFKRLRKNHQYNDKILYYLVGEYGDHTARPHYHCILFNSDIPTIEKSWKLGHVYYGDVNMQSIMYTLSYMLKYQDRKNTFTLSSKHLGETYLSYDRVKWHCDDILLRYYAPYEKNKIPLPRYLKERIYSEDERKLITAECLDGQLWSNVDKNSLDYLENLWHLRNEFPINYKPKSKNLQTL